MSLYFIYYSLGKDYVLPVKQKNTDRNHVIEPKTHTHTHTHTQTEKDDIRKGWCKNK